MKEKTDEKYFNENQIKAARFAKALGHPVRIYIIELLSKQTCCYSGDMAEVLPIAKSTLSQHLKELKKCKKQVTKKLNDIIDIIDICIENSSIEDAESNLGEELFNIESQIAILLGDLENYRKK